VRLNIYNLNIMFYDNASNIKMVRNLAFHMLGQTLTCPQRFTTRYQLVNFSIWRITKNLKILGAFFSLTLTQKRCVGTLGWDYDKLLLIFNFTWKKAKIMTSIFLHLGKDILLSILGVGCTPKLSNDKTQRMPLPFCVRKSNVKIN
jgi:hypothetical protein